MRPPAIISLLFQRREHREFHDPGKNLIVIIPAYNAEKTLRKTYEELPHEYIDNIVLVDDASPDRTAVVAMVATGYSIGEISCPARYFEDASSINFPRSVKYGFGVLATSLKYLLQRTGAINYRLFTRKESK